MAYLYLVCIIFVYYLCYCYNLPATIKIDPLHLQPVLGSSYYCSSTLRTSGSGTILLTVPSIKYQVSCIMYHVSCIMAPAGRDGWWVRRGPLGWLAGDGWVTAAGRPLMGRYFFPSLIRFFSSLAHRVFFHSLGTSSYSLTSRQLILRSRDSYTVIIIIRWVRGCLAAWSVVATVERQYVLVLLLYSAPHPIRLRRF